MQNDIDIRAAERDDLPAILSLFAQTDMDGEAVLALEDALPIFERIQQPPDHTMYVAVRDGEIIGTFTLLVVQQLTHRGARSGLVEDVVVQADQRGQGVGQAMMAFATEVLRAAGCYKVVLSSGARRVDAHRFYERLGFRKHGESFLLDLPNFRAGD